MFRMSHASTGKLLEDIFEGNRINTPSMLCVEDYLDAPAPRASVARTD
uniref:Polyketide synthase n=1 Tax=Peronospora matthiolae TaxID=2874970 RepID=A0AAV1U603_9STRA